MSAADIPLGRQASQLRRAFDRSFADPPRETAADMEDFLAIRIAAAPFALPLREVTGLFADKHISPVPSGVRELLGIAGFRGTIVPIYDLGALLGYAPSSAPRWLAIAAKAPVALAFDALDGHLRLSRDAIATDAQARQRHVRESACAPQPRPIIRLASVLDAIERRARGLATTAEK